MNRHGSFVINDGREEVDVISAVTDFILNHRSEFPLHDYEPRQEGGEDSGEFESEFNGVEEFKAGYQSSF